jgi:ribosomal protein S18 acetylase RimI-like enzyme
VEIINTTTEDLEFIYHLFDEAINYQKRKGFPIWNGYDKIVLQTDVANKLQFKIVTNNTIACVFSICFSDSIIWRTKEQCDALYLHRIVVNPNFKGQQQFKHILEWAKIFAINKGLKFVRLDTWGHNENILNYYKQFGFSIVENYTTPNSQELPVQHRNLLLALLEYKL